MCTHGDLTNFRQPTVEENGKSAKGIHENWIRIVLAAEHSVLTPFGNTFDIGERNTAATRSQLLSVVEIVFIP